MKWEARLVGMLVYIKMASAMNRDEFGGTARAERSFFRSKLLLKNDHCAFAAICSLFCQPTHQLLG
jgi:hypothetical protein